jgi:hypothetical protein
MISAATSSPRRSDLCCFGNVGLPVRISLHKHTHHTTTHAYRQRYHDKEEDKAAVSLVLAAVAERGGASCEFVKRMRSDAQGMCIRTTCASPWS